MEAQRQALRDRMVQLNVRMRELEASVTTEEPVLRWGLCRLREHGTVCFIAVSWFGALGPGMLQAC